MIHQSLDDWTYYAFWCVKLESGLTLVFHFVVVKQVRIVGCLYVFLLNASMDMVRCFRHDIGIRRPRCLNFGLSLDPTYVGLPLLCLDFAVRLCGHWYITLTTVLHYPFS